MKSREKKEKEAEKDGGGAGFRAEGGGGEEGGTRANRFGPYICPRAANLACDPSSRLLRFPLGAAAKNVRRSDLGRRIKVDRRSSHCTSVLQVPRSHGGSSLPSVPTPPSGPSSTRPDHCSSIDPLLPWHV